MSKILFISDFDNCIMHDNFINVRAWRKLIAMVKNGGTSFVPCSGRPGPMIQGLQFWAQGTMEYGIGENGSVLIDLSGKAVDYHKLASLDELKVIWNLKDQLRDRISDGVDFKLEPGKKYSVTLHYGKSFKTGLNFQEEFERFLPKMLTKEERIKIKYALTSDGLDIFTASCDKGRAIEEVLHKYKMRGVKFDQIVYVGDSFNDLPGIRYVKLIGGIILAPANVTKEIRQYVDIVGKYKYLWGIIDAFSKII